VFKKSKDPNFIFYYHNLREKVIHVGEIKYTECNLLFLKGEITFRNVIFYAMKC